MYIIHTGISIMQAGVIHHRLNPSFPKQFQPICLELQYAVHDFGQHLFIHFNKKNTKYSACCEKSARSGSHLVSSGVLLGLISGNIPPLSSTQVQLAQKKVFVFRLFRTSLAPCRGRYIYMNLKNEQWCAGASICEAFVEGRREKEEPRETSTSFQAPSHGLLECW